MINFYELAGVVVCYLLVSGKEIKTANKATRWGIWSLLALAGIVYFLMKVNGENSRPVDLLQNMLRLVVPFR